MYCKGDMFLHTLWNAKHLSMFVENKYLVWFAYTDFLTLISSFNTNPGYWKISVEYIWTKSVSSLDRDEVKVDLMLVNMKNDTFLPLFCRKC